MGNHPAFRLRLGNPTKEFELFTKDSRIILKSVSCLFKHANKQWGHEISKNEPKIKMELFAANGGHFSFDYRVSELFHGGAVLAGRLNGFEMPRSGHGESLMGHQTPFFNRIKLTLRQENTYIPFEVSISYQDSR